MPYVALAPVIPRPLGARPRSRINSGFAACRQSVRSGPSQGPAAMLRSSGRAYSVCRECNRTWKTPDTASSFLFWSRRLIG